MPQYSYYSLWIVSQRQTCSSYVGFLAGASLCGGSKCFCVASSMGNYENIALNAGTDTVLFRYSSNLTTN